MVIFGGYDLDMVRRPTAKGTAGPQVRREDLRRYSEEPLAEHNRGNAILRRESPTRLRGGQGGHEVVGADKDFASGSFARGGDAFEGKGKEEVKQALATAGRQLLQGNTNKSHHVEQQRTGKHEETRGSEARGNFGNYEPVIIWTPVVKYRGALSYWTIELTGWRMENGTTENDGNENDRSVLRREGQGRDRGQHEDVVIGSEMCPTGCQAIVDTGSSLLVPPRREFRAVMEQIIGGKTDCKEQHGMVTCSTCSPSDFPDIVISVATSKRPLSRPAKDRDRDDGIANHPQLSGSSSGGSEGGDVPSKEFRLKPSDYLAQSWDGCEILVGEGRATDIWTLGDAFIKTYMTIFDVANLRVGFVCADGGRCLGGAAPVVHPRSRLCLPFRSGGDEVDDFDVSCMRIKSTVITWVLVTVTVLLIVIACILWADDTEDVQGGGDPGPEKSRSPKCALPSTFPSSLRSDERLCSEEQQSESAGSFLESRGDGGRGLSLVRRPERSIGDGWHAVVSGMERASTRRRDLEKGWTHAPKALLLSWGRRAGWVSTEGDLERSPPPTRSRSNSHSETGTAARVAPRRFCPEGDDGVVVVASKSGGMRSRGGTPRAAAIAHQMADGSIDRPSSTSCVSTRPRIGVL